MSRSGRHIAMVSLLVIGSGALTHAQDAPRQPLAFDVDDAIIAPFLMEQRETTSFIDNNASAVATGVLGETGTDNASLTAFSGYSAAVSQLDELTRIEVRVHEPNLLTRSDRLFDSESEVDSAIIRPMRETRSSVAVDYVTRFESHGGETGLDLSFEPRAGVSIGPEGSGAGAGAEVRVGRYLQNDQDQSSWYLFAGAERRALLYDPSAGWNMRGAMTLEPYAVVGDAQAGVAMRFGDNDLSFAYVRRERTARIGIDDYDAADDFAAFSLSRRW